MRPNDPVFRSHLPAPPISSSSCLFPRGASYLSYPCRSPYEQPPLVKVEHKSFYPGGPVQVRRVTLPHTLHITTFIILIYNNSINLTGLLLLQIISAVSSNVPFLHPEKHRLPSPLHRGLHPRLHYLSSPAALPRRDPSSGDHTTCRPRDLLST